MSGSRERILDGIAAMLETNGISIDELQRHLESGDSGVTLQMFLDAETPKMPKDTRRTSLTSLRLPRLRRCEQRSLGDLSTSAALRRSY